MINRYQGLVSEFDTIALESEERNRRILLIAKEEEDCESKKKLIDALIAKEKVLFTKCLYII